MAADGSIVIDTRVDNSGADNGLKDLSKKLKDTGKGFKDVGDKLNKWVTLPIIGAGAAAIKMAMDQESAFAQLSTIMEGSKKDFDDYKNKIRDVAAEMGISFEEYTGAVYDAISSGIEQGKAIEFTAKAVKLAKGGFTTAGKAVDVLTTAINAYGLSADDATKLSDMLIETQNAGKTTVDQLASSMGAVIPVANAQNVAFDQLSTGYAILTANGIATSESGTYLKAMFSELGKSGTIADKVIRKMSGQSFSDFMASGKSVGDALNLLQGFADKAGVKLTDLFGSVEAGTAALVLSKDGSKQFTDELGNMRNSTGLTKDAFEKMADTTENKTKKAIEALKESLAKIGDIILPIIVELSAKVAELAAKFDKLSPAQKETIMKFALAAAAIGPLLVGIGNLISSVGVIVNVVGKLGPILMGAGESAGLLATAFEILTGPIGWIILAVTALIAIFVTLYKNNEDFRNKVLEIWGKIKEGFTVALNAIIKVVKSVMNEVVSFSKDILGKFKGFWDENGTAIMKIVNFVFGAIWTQIKTTLGLIKGIFEAVWPILVASVKLTWAAIKTVISVALDLIMGLVKFWIKIFTGDWKGAFEAIKDIFKNIWNDIVKIFKDIDLAKIGEDIVNGLIKGLKSMGKAVTNAGEWLADLIPDGIKKVLKIQSPSKITELLGEHTGEGLNKGLKSKGKVVKKTAQQVANEAKSAFEKELKSIDLRLDTKKINAEQAIAELEKLKTKYKSVKDVALLVQKEIMGIQKKHAQELEDLRKQQFEKEKQTIDDRKYYNKLSLTEELKMLEGYMAKYKAGSEERQYYEREVYRVKKEINDKLIAINQEYAAKMSEINQNMINEEKRLTEEYTKAVDDRTRAIASFAGIFDEVKDKSDITGQQLLKNMQDQVTTIENWMANLKSLSAKGVDSNLMADLQQLGPNAAAEIAALNTLSDAELQKYVELWKQKNALARQQATDELQGLKDDTQTKIDELHKNTQTQLEKLKTEWIKKIQEIKKGTSDEFSSMKDIGANAVKGIMSGLDSMSGELLKKAKEIAAAVTKEMQKALGIKSPSTVMRDKVGKWIPAGVAKGIDDNLDVVVNATNKMSKAAIPDSANINNTQTVNNTIGSAQFLIPLSELKEISEIVDLFKRLSQASKVY